jgi:hypothetical protein
MTHKWKLCNITSFIIRTFHALISCIENTFGTRTYWKMQNSCDIFSFIGSYFIHQHNYPYAKHVFNAWYSCVKCTNLWMNKLCMIFIINLLHVKFLLNIEGNIRKIENKSWTMNCEVEGVVQSFGFYQREGCLVDPRLIDIVVEFPRCPI